MASVLSVNVGTVRTTPWLDRTITSGIWKYPVSGRIAARDHQLAGDEQADTISHGGPDKAVLAYDDEDYAWWSAELGRSLEPGIFGENLTTAGISLSDAIIGERWRIGSAEIQISQARLPCRKLSMRLGDPNFKERFTVAARPGAYFRITKEGGLSAGDAIEVVDRPSHSLTVQEMFRICTVQRDRAAELLDISDVPQRWRDWAQKQQLQP